MKPVIVALLIVAAIGSAPVVSTSAAAALSENAPIPGGTAALAHALRVDGVPDRASFVTELTRVIYNVPEGKSATTDALLQDLAKHLEVVGQFQARLTAVQPQGGSISLAMADDKNNRNRLKEFLDLVGLRLREKNKKFSVERTDSKQAAGRLRVLSELGVDLGELESQLNGGQAVKVELPTETVPIPLTAALWSSAIFQRQIALAGLFSAIIADRRAALLCHGLAALDDETLQFLADRPELLKRLYEHDAGPFAAFGGSLRIRDGKIVLAGGASSLPLWEAVVDEKVARPDRFVRELFGRDAGRVAFLYDAVSHLDSARAAFALGLTIKDASLRVDRFRGLASTVTSNGLLDFAGRPFTRPPTDTVLLLARIHARADGAPASPEWRQFWSRAFDGTDLPDNPSKLLKNIQEDGVVDAAWFAEALQSAEIRFHGERLDQIDFGHRVFSTADAAALPDALVAVRTFPRYRMLMLTLERMGIRTPATYAAAARHANRLSTLDPNHGFVALSQFQGALAIIARLAHVHTIDAAAAESLVSSLSAVNLTDDGRYAGGVARWLNEKLSGVIGNTPDVEDGLTIALAGRAGVPTAPSVLVTWEDRQYKLDLATPEVHRLTRMRERLGAPALQAAIDLARTADALSAPGLAFEQLAPLTAELKKTQDALAPPQKKKSKAPSALPPGIDQPRSAHEVVGKSIQDLSKITKPKDLKKAAHAAEPLFDVVDELLGDALLSQAYALDLGDPEGDALLAGNVSRRHDFGYAEHVGDLRVRAPWATPWQVWDAGVPWHVSGSALGLDLALSPLSLHRMTTSKVTASSTLSMVQRNTFSETVALMNPLDLRDADLDAVAAAIERGRAMVGAIDGPSRLNEIADAVQMDGWRRQSIRWTVVNDPKAAASFFSLRELLYLGDPQGASSVDRIGMAAGALNGCLCTALPPPGAWMVAMGRAQVGLMSVYVADLNLHVLLALHDLHLPAALARGVLASAVQDYLDEARPIEADDWLSLVRAAQHVPRERIEDYVATLTANGPLISESASADGKHR